MPHRVQPSPATHLPRAVGHTHRAQTAYKRIDSNRCDARPRKPGVGHVVGDDVPWPEVLLESPTLLHFPDRQLAYFSASLCQHSFTFPNATSRTSLLRSGTA
ncbi:hypothetical protein H4Q26_009538 [Puccinia striiformis f. sp. tritici PST-130]|nr:hypothetical protein H4Q26_009538 [Puccinia striiformis f. sp. tritici PST-130]